MPHVTEINHLAELDRYQLPWKALLGQTRGATFCRSLECLQAYWRSSGGDRRLRVLIVHSMGDLIGILPLSEKTTSTRIGSIRVLTFPLDTGDCYGPIGPNPTATLVCAIGHLSAHRDWDVLDLRGIAAEFDAGRTELAMRCAGLQSRPAAWNTSLRIDFDGSWHQYRASLGTRFDERLQHAELSANSGSLSYERYRPLGSMCGDDDLHWDWFDECVELESGNGPLELNLHDEVASGGGLCRELHSTVTRAGALDFNLLRWNGRIVAFAYNHHWDGALQGVWYGADEHSLPFSPTLLLLARMVGDSFQRGDRVLHFGSAWQNRVSGWQTQADTTLCCSHYSVSSPSSQLLRLSHWLFRVRRASAQVTAS